MAADSKNKKENSYLEISESSKNETILIKPNALRGKGTIPLSMTEQRILFYSIYKIQHNKDSISFTKQEIDEIYDTDFGSYKDIKKYLRHLVTYGAELSDDDSEKAMFIPAFSALSYDKGLFTFKFNQMFLPAVEGNKRFFQLGMKSLRKFKCKYSIYLYDYLKDNMWGDYGTKRNLSLVEFKAIFKLEPTAYKGRNANFKARVWQPALEEINLFTDYFIEVIQAGRGDTATFTLLRVENEDLRKSSKPFKCPLSKKILDWSCMECQQINRCNVRVTEEFFKYKDEIPFYATDCLNAYYMYKTFFGNPQYSVYERVRNNVANAYEVAFYKEAVETFKTRLKDEENRTQFTEKELKEDVELTQEDYILRFTPLPGENY